MGRKHRWLDRRLMVGPYLTLCTTKRQYHRALRDSHVERGTEEWVKWGDGAKTHIISADRMVCIVCCPAQKRPTKVIAAMMAHEACHIWERYCEWIGERRPASEQAAYAVQHLTYILTDEYLRQVR